MFLRKISKKIPRNVFFLLISTFLLVGCAADYETKTARGEVIREWFIPFTWGRVEAFAAWPPDRGHLPQRRYPAILLLHGADARAQRFRRAILAHVRDGLILMSISLPGFGASTGPEDFAGPRSVEASQGAVRYLSTRENVRKDGIFIYGIGQGASAAALAAARSAKISGLVLENGFYDLEKTYGRLSQKQKNRIRAVLGGAPDQAGQAYRERSPIRAAEKIKAPVLLLHSQGEPYPLSGAEAFLKIIRGKGGRAELQRIKKQGPFESLTHPNIANRVIPFIRKILKTR